MRKAILTLTLVGMLALPVLAQRFGGGFMGGATGDALLANKSVQDELKLSDAQKKDIKTASDARQEAFRKAREDKDQEGVQKAQQDFTKAMTKVREGLKSDQRKRLVQIEVQLATKNNSVRIFNNPDIQKALNLTEKQKKTLKSTLSDLDKDTKELFEDAKGDFKKLRGMREKMTEMNKEAFTTVTKTLTDEQKKTWKTLGGEKFEGKGFPFEGFGGGFGKEKGKGRKDKGRKKKDDF